VLDRNDRAPDLHAAGADRLCTVRVAIRIGPGITSGVTLDRFERPSLEPRRELLVGWQVRQQAGKVAELVDLRPTGGTALEVRLEPGNLLIGQGPEQVAGDVGMGLGVGGGVSH
jgi:hypothetical protein